MVATSSAPIPKSQYSGLSLARLSCRIIYRGAPMNAPYRRPVPPRINMIITSPERSKLSTSSATNSVVWASKAPAMPAMTAARV